MATWLKAENDYFFFGGHWYFAIPKDMDGVGLVKCLLYFQYINGSVLIFHCQIWAALTFKPYKGNL